MTTSESKGRSFFLQNELIRITNRFRIANWNALLRRRHQAPRLDDRARGVGGGACNAPLPC